MEYRFTTIIVVAALIVLASYASGQISPAVFGHSWSEVLCNYCVRAKHVDTSEIVIVPYLNNRLTDYVTFDLMNQMIAAALAGQPMPEPPTAPPPPGPGVWSYVCTGSDVGANCRTNCGDYCILKSGDVIYVCDGNEYECWNCQPAEEACTQGQSCDSLGGFCVLNAVAKWEITDCGGLTEPLFIYHDAGVVYKCVY